jgi:uridine kinase
MENEKIKKEKRKIRIICGIFFIYNFKKIIKYKKIEIFFTTFLLGF